MPGSKAPRAGSRKRLAKLTDDSELEQEGETQRKRDDAELKTRGWSQRKRRQPSPGKQKSLSAGRQRITDRPRTFAPSVKLLFLAFLRAQASTSSTELPPSAVKPRRRPSTSSSATGRYDTLPDSPGPSSLSTWWAMTACL